MTDTVLSDAIYSYLLYLLKKKSLHEEKESISLQPSLKYSSPEICP